MLEYPKIKKFNYHYHRQELAEVIGLYPETSEEYKLKVEFKIPHASISPNGISVNASGECYQCCEVFFLQFYGSYLGF